MNYDGIPGDAFLFSVFSGFHDSDVSSMHPSWPMIQETPSNVRFLASLSGLKSSPKPGWACASSSVVECRNLGTLLADLASRWASALI